MINSGKPVHCLVTGATGSLGKELVARLLERGWRVTALSRNPANAGGRRVSSQVRWVRGDVRLAESLCQLSPVPVIFHLASHPFASDPHDTLHKSVTVDGTQNLLDVVAQWKVPPQIVFASSVKAHGETTWGCADEESPDHPVSPYGRAKKAAEDLLLCFGKQHGSQVTILRLPPLYGIQGRGSIAQLISWIRKYHLPDFPYTGNLRSFLHVTDAAEACVTAIEQSLESVDRFYVTDGAPVSTERLFRVIRGSLRRAPCVWSGRLFWKTLEVSLSAVSKLSDKPDVFARKLDEWGKSSCYTNTRFVHMTHFAPRYTIESQLPKLVHAQVAGE